MPEDTGFFGTRNTKQDSRRKEEGVGVDVVVVDVDVVVVGFFPHLQHSSHG